MDISKTISILKEDPEFSKNVGMVLVHNGIVRGSSRNDPRQVSSVEITSNHQKITELCQEAESLPGIYKVVAEAKSGILNPGDDVLFIVVAGDFRENVKAALAELLDRIKAEAVQKREIFHT